MIGLSGEIPLVSHSDVTSPFPPSGNGGYASNLDVLNPLRLLLFLCVFINCTQRLHELNYMLYILNRQALISLVLFLGKAEALLNFHRYVLMLIFTSTLTHKRFTHVLFVHFSISCFFPLFDCFFYYYY